MVSKILLVGADEDTRRRCKDMLSSAGYELLFADTPSPALTTLRRENPVLVLLDISHSTEGIFEFITAVRVENNLPIVLRTGTETEALAIEALAFGADDYLLTTTGINEMAARLLAIIRRHKPQSSGALRVGQVIINPEKRTVYVNHIPINLTPTEFDLLAILMSAPRNIFSRQALRQSLPGNTSNHAIVAHIRNLRAKITPHTNTNPIETVYGRGYRFMPEDDE